eukprot:CFRG5347T1
MLWGTKRENRQQEDRNGEVGTCLLDDDVRLEPIFFQTLKEKQESWTQRMWRNISETVIQHAEFPHTSPTVSLIDKEPPRRHSSLNYSQYIRSVDNVGSIDVNIGSTSAHRSTDVRKIRPMDESICSIGESGSADIGGCMSRQQKSNNLSVLTDRAKLGCVDLSRVESETSGSPQISLDVPGLVSNALVKHVSEYVPSPFVANVNEMPNVDGPLRRVRKENMLLLGQEQQHISPSNRTVAHRYLKIHLAVAQYVFSVHVDDLKPIYRIAENKRTTAVRLNHIRGELVRANPWLETKANMYCEWWKVAATTNFKDVYEFLVSDMKDHVTDRNVLFLRPQTVLGHMRHISTDANSLHSSMGLSYTAASEEITDQALPSIVGDIVGALAMMSALPQSKSSHSIVSQSSGLNEEMQSSATNSAFDIHTETSTVISDNFFDASSMLNEPGHFGDGIDNVSIAGYHHDERIVPCNAIFVLLDRNLAPVAKIMEHQLTSGSVESINTCSYSPHQPLIICPDLKWHISVPYVRKDIPVEFLCDVAFEYEDHVPRVLRNATFKKASLVGTAVIVQRSVLGPEDVLPRSECIAITDLTVDVAQHTRLGPYAIEATNSAVCPNGGV